MGMETGRPVNVAHGGGGHVRVTIATNVGRGNGGASLPCVGCILSPPAANSGVVRFNIGVAASDTVGAEIPKASANTTFVPIDDVSLLYFYGTNADVIDIVYFK